MYAKLLGFSLFACHIILNSASVISENRDSVEDAAPTETRSTTIPEGYVAFPEDHVAYKIYKEVLTWAEARDRCIADGARLAIADTREKIVHINSLKGEDWGTQWLHVGIHRWNTTSEWVRVDNGLPLTSLPWAEEYPDDDGDCVGIIFNENGLLNYYGEPASRYFHFVCEFPMQEN